ncbi:MAG: flagellar hook basal-body protein [Thermoguttaceae bacterium]
MFRPLFRLSSLSPIARLTILPIVSCLVCCSIFAEEPLFQTDDPEWDTTISEALRDPGFRDFLRRTGSDSSVIQELQQLEKTEKMKKIEKTEKNNRDSAVSLSSWSETAKSPFDNFSERLDLSDASIMESGWLLRDFLTLKGAIEGLRNQETTGYKERFYTIKGSKKGLETGKTTQSPGSNEQTITRLNLREGPLQSTGRDLDTAIRGKGFFRVRCSDSSDILYTRCGAFEPDENGRLILVADGMVRAIEPTIVIPVDCVDITISEIGLVLGKVADGTEKELGQLTLSWFRNPNRVEPVDDYCLRATPFSGPAIDAQPGSAGLGTIKQGVLEQSNVLPDQLKERIERVQMSKMLREMLDSFDLNWIKRQNR